MTGFPTYSRAERAADTIMHAIGVPAGVIAAGWLLMTAGRSADDTLLMSLAVYAAGLVGMLTASAAYHLAPDGRAKALLRRVDHAMIFVMIAGTYTPFALNVLQPPGGVVMCAAMWAAAAGGVAAKLAFPRRLERLSLVLYLGMGWSILVMIRPLIGALPPDSLYLLLGGGIVYSLGTVVYMSRRVRFHTALWHALVLVAAGLHVTALHYAFAGA